MVELLFCNQRVAGSIPAGSSNKEKDDNMNVIVKIKDEIKKLFCFHEWYQHGDILCINKQVDEMQNNKYYCELRCKKCGAVRFELISLPHRL